MSDNKGMSRLSDMMSRSNPNSLNSDTEKTPSLASTLDFTKSQAQRDEEQMPQRRMVYPRQLQEFPEHPFHVREDEEMTTLRNSIMKYGVRTPVEVFPTGEKNEQGEDTYYIVSGHRRTHAFSSTHSVDARMEVRVMTYSFDEAIVAMTEANLLSRENIRPCERGNAFRMQLEAMDRMQGRPNSKDTKMIFGKGRDIIGEKNNMTGRQVQKYIRLSYLIPDMQTIIDDGKVGMTTGVELSYLTADEQQAIFDEILLNDGRHYPSKEQAKQMRKLSKDGKLDIDAIVDIMAQEKPNQMAHYKVSFRTEEIQQRLPAHLKSKNWGQKEFEAFVEDAIDCYIKQLNQARQQEESQQQNQPVRAWERSRRGGQL